MTACSQYIEKLNTYADGMLSDGERAEVEVHLEGCAACREYLADIIKLRAGLAGADGGAELPEGFKAGVIEALRAEKGRKKRVFIRRFGTAAAAVFVIAAAVYIRPALFDKNEAAPSSAQSIRMANETYSAAATAEAAGENRVVCGKEDMQLPSFIDNPVKGPAAAAAGGADEINGGAEADNDEIVMCGPEDMVLPSVMQAEHADGTAAEAENGAAEKADSDAGPLITREALEDIIYIEPDARFDEEAFAFVLTVRSGAAQDRDAKNWELCTQSEAEAVMRDAASGMEYEYTPMNGEAGEGIVIHV